MNLDWGQIILNLRTAGMPLPSIARKVRMDVNTCRRYVRGESLEPRFSQGVALLDLHISLCPDKHDIGELSK